LGDRLELRVLDDGVGLPAGWSLDTSAGLGLSVTRARVEGLDQDGGSHLVVERRAAGGHDRAVPFPKTRLTHVDRNAPHLPGRRDFSFSGLKTSVLRHVTLRRAELGLAGDASLPEDEIAHVCASFQRVAVENLLDPLFDAARWYDARSVGIAGGVSANSRLRADAILRGDRRGLPVFIPSLALSTDNAAMIAAAGLRRYRTGVESLLDVNADASLAL
jgi:N6-L-threonylcarbamoyladenine synthase